MYRPLYFNLSIRVLQRYIYWRHRVELAERKTQIWSLILDCQVYTIFQFVFIWEDNHGSILLHGVHVTEVVFPSFTYLWNSVVGWFVIRIAHVLTEAFAFLVEAISVESSVFELGCLTLVTRNSPYSRWSLRRASYRITISWRRRSWAHPLNWIPPSILLIAR